MWTGQHVAVTYDWSVISLVEEFLHVSGITCLALFTTLTVLALVFSTAEFYPTSILDAGRSNPVPNGPRLPFLSNGGLGVPVTIQLAFTHYRSLQVVHSAPHQSCMKQVLANKTTGTSLWPCQRQSSLQTFGRNNTTTAERIITAPTRHYACHDQLFAQLIALHGRRKFNSDGKHYRHKPHCLD